MIDVRRASTRRPPSERPLVRFLPKDEGFFGLFDQLSARLKSSSALLKELFSEPHRLEELTVKIKAEEHAADAITYDIMQRIDRSFVTPLDREDIHRLANRLDNVVDLMDGTARRAKMYHITERRDAAIALVDVLVECSATIAAGVKEIRTPASVHKAARRIKELEEKGFLSIRQQGQGKPNLYTLDLHAKLLITGTASRPDRKNLPV